MREGGSFLGDSRRTRPSSPLQFGEDGCFTLKVANDLATREQAYRLVYELFRQKGIARPDPVGMSYSLWNAALETTTLCVEYDRRVVGVLTFYQDSPLGLPADEEYRAELNVLRRSGKRLCELGSLGVAPEFASAGSIVPRLFEASFLLANDIRKRTHAVVECHPSHAHLYRDLLEFEQLGVEGSLERLNDAPVILVAKDLSDFERRHTTGISAAAWTAGGLAESPRAAARRRTMVRGLKRMLHPMSEEELRHFFIDRKPLLERATSEQREYVRSCYAGYDLPPGSVTTAAPASGAESEVVDRR